MSFAFFTEVQFASGRITIKFSVTCLVSLPSFHRNLETLNVLVDALMLAKSPEVGIANFFLSPLIANPLIFFESAKR